MKFLVHFLVTIYEYNILRKISRDNELSLIRKKERKIP